MYLSIWYISIYMYIYAHICSSNQKQCREKDKFFTWYVCVYLLRVAEFSNAEILEYSVKVFVIWLVLTHRGRVMHICISKITIIGSDNGLSPGRCQAIIWTNAVILFIEPLGTNFSEILIAIHIVSLQKMHFNMLSGKWWPFCLGLNVLNN